MKRRSDEEISAPLYEYDAAVRSQYGCFAGVDEAGRGPLCGPVCVAACILDPENPVYGINDSKKLTEKKREALFDEIVAKALAYKIIFVGPEVIDRENILNATMGGMKQAVEELAMNLLDEVRRNYPDLVAQRYKLDAETLALPPYELMEAIGRKRGLLVRGGEVNTERCAIMLVDEFRACKWGRISLERPPQRDDLADFAEEDEE